MRAGMSSSYFVDTNVLVYARDTSEPHKQPRAEAWIEYLWKMRAARISTQVLQEYYQTVTRKLKPGLTPEEARADIRDLGLWKPIQVDASILEQAWRFEDKFRFSWWDALIVAAAHRMECRFLLTEDLNAGQIVDGIEIINPFQSAPPSA